MKDKTSGPKESPLTEKDDIDVDNGFVFQDHFTLKSTFHKRKGLVLLNEGSKQYIFQPVQSYDLYNDTENGFLLVTTITCFNI